MPETLADEREKLKEAYDMGYEEFSSLDIEDGEDVDLAPFHSTARYCNNILPELRTLAGYKDPMGVGTYQECPNDAVRHFYEELVETWNDGAFDAIQGREKDHTRHIGSDI